MIEGTTLKLRGKEYVIPALSLKQWKKFLPLIRKLQSCGNTAKNITGLATIAHAALSRNYPDLKVEDVEDLIDLSNILTIMEAIMPFRLLQGKMTMGKSGMMS